MCLSRLSQRPKKSKNFKLRKGWKIVEVYINHANDRAKPKAQYMHQYHKGRTTIFLDRWLESKKKVKRFADNIRYAPRFHVYLTRPEKREESGSIAIVPVRFKSPVATGYQEGLACVVASKIFLSQRSVTTAFKRVRGEIK